MICLSAYCVMMIQFKEMLGLWCRSHIRAKKTRNPRFGIAWKWSGSLAAFFNITRTNIIKTMMAGIPSKHSLRFSLILWTSVALRLLTMFLWHYGNEREARLVLKVGWTCVLAFLQTMSLPDGKALIAGSERVVEFFQKAVDGNGKLKEGDFIDDVSSV